MTQMLRAVRESRLTSSQRLVAMTITSLANTQTGVIPEQYQPTPDDLVRDTGLSRATVYRCIGEIQAAGWIERGLAEGRTSRIVAVLIPAQSQCETEDEFQSHGETGSSHVETESHTETGQSHTETNLSHTETDTSIHGTYGTKEPSSSPKPSKKPKPRRPDVEQICEHLADRIEANGSKRPTITDNWQTAGRLLLDADQRTVDQVLRAIDWCQTDEFWRSNVLSMPTLRKKYDQLRLAAMRANGRASPPTLVEQDGLRLKPETVQRLKDRARFEAMDAANRQPAIGGPPHEPHRDP